MPKLCIFLLRWSAMFVCFQCECAVLKELKHQGISKTAGQFCGVETPPLLQVGASHYHLFIQVSAPTIRYPTLAFGSSHIASLLYHHAQYRHSSHIASSPYYHAPYRLTIQARHSSHTHYFEKIRADSSPRPNQHPPTKPHHHPSRSHPHPSIPSPHPSPSPSSSRHRQAWSRVYRYRTAR